MNAQLIQSSVSKKINDFLHGNKVKTTQRQPSRAETRVLQISKFYRPVSGGIESVVSEITEGLVDEQINTTVLCTNINGETLVENQRYKIIRSGIFGKVLSTPISTDLIWQLIKRRKDFDIIHVHLPNPIANLGLFIANPSAKIIVHWHSDIVKQKRALKLYAPLQNWLLKRADAIIATTEPYANSSNWLKPFSEKVKVIPIGIKDPSINNTQTDESLAIQSIKNRYGNRRIIFSLGRMIYYKGFENLIDAATNLPDDSCVVIGGTGELFESLQQRIIQKGLKDKVYLVGRISEQEMSAYYKAADLFCLPSILRSEAFGVVLLEAMAYSLPIVTTNILGSGVPWVNQHNKTGINVEPNNTEELAEAINYLLNNKEVAKSMGYAAKKRFESEFKASDMVNRVIDLYDTISKNKKTVDMPIYTFPKQAKFIQ